MSLGLVPFQKSNQFFLRLDRERGRRVTNWPTTRSGIPPVDLPLEGWRRTPIPMGASIYRSAERVLNERVGEGNQEEGWKMICFLPYVSNLRRCAKLADEEAR
jgi:hypothetical protein